MSNKIRLRIGGIEYSVTSNEEESYILSLGAELEKKMNTVMAKSPFLSTTMAAVMTALETMDDTKKIQTENEGLRLENKRLLEEAAMARMDADITRRMLIKFTGEEVEEKKQTFTNEDDEEF